MDIFDLSAKITLDSSGFEQGVNSASSSMDGLSAKAVALGTALYDIGKQAVSAFGKLSKAALEGYANFEQLSGGIDTLFASASDAVMKNAEQAFKTAGMSANEYMETAIGFSAALINSVGGDTERAAGLADRAITDMSDNANKMGTTLESLQNAYRGFSRGNFTMLDNLALGFSGTKEGMQELLDKAEELSGVEFDISSYADIVEAIHVVQEEMGITGTTAAEAAGTISGSVQTMKAAWDNWLAGLGNADADMSGLTDNLVSSIETVWNNIKPTLETIGSNLLGVFQNATGIDPAPIIDVFTGIGDALGQAATALGQGDIVGAIDSLLTSLGNATGLDFSGVGGAISGIATALSGASEGFQADGITGAIDSLVTSLSSATGLDLSGISDAISGVTSALSGAAEGFQADGITGALDSLVTSLSSATGLDLSGLVDGIQGFFSAFDGIEPGVLDGVQSAIEGLMQNFKNSDIADTVSSVASGLGKVFKTIGEALDFGIDVIAEIISQLARDFDTWAPGIAAVVTGILTFNAAMAAMSFIQNIPAMINAVKIAFAGLNAVMAANPIGLVLSLLAALIAAFITAYQTNDEFREKLGKAWDDIKKFAQDLWETIKKVFTEDIPRAISAAVTAIKEKATEFINAGKELISGFISGITEKLGAAKEAISDAAGAVVDWVKGIFDIHSPSRVFKEIGEYAMEGLAIGFEDGANRFSKRINKSVTGLIPSNMTASVDFASSSLGKSSAAQINTMLAGMEERGGNYNINLVVDGRTLANVVFDPLNAVSKQKGVAIGA